MKKDYNIFIPCDEAQHVCDKSQYNEASLLEKIKLSLHLAFCKVCLQYNRNNTKLTAVIKKSNSQESLHLELSEKNSLQSMFEKELRK